jgi:hypothetical protein
VLSDDRVIEAYLGSRFAKRAAAVTGNGTGSAAAVPKGSDTTGNTP